jgi:uncharacterized protein (TIGR03435 family)
VVSPALDAASVKAVREARTWAVPPRWIFEERFEIQATMGSPASAAEVRTMVQALLGDRFKLKLHRETREIPVCALLVGRGGPKFEDSGRRNSARGKYCGRPAGGS